MVVKEIRNVTSILKRLKQPVRNPHSFLSQAFIKGVRHLLTCPWWSRLWVLHEATLAREAMFVCGSQTLSWKDLSALTKQINRLDLFGIFRGHDRVPEFCDGFTELHNVEQVQHTHSTTLASNLVRICRQRICSDPCDRIYGIVGLMEPYVREGFTWNPGEKVEDLYPPFLGILLQVDTVAFLLSLTETTQRNPHLPSWCPDLHYRSLGYVLADHEGYHAGFNIQTMPKFDWEQYQRDPRKLRTKGSIADTVKTIHQGDWLQDTYSHSAQELLFDSVLQSNIALLQNFMGLAEQVTAQGELWRVFVGNMYGDEQSRLHFLAGFSRLHDRLSKQRWKDTAQDLQRGFRDLRAWSADISEMSPALTTYLKLAQKICFGRKFFSTAAGRIGFGPRTMSVGDVVCIIKGAKVAFVLAPHPTLLDAYYLKGEAYVHGLMHGEYLKAGKQFDWILLV
jgi:hypothetical protein